MTTPVSCLQYDSTVFYVYLIHNIRNNKVYVGKTDDISRRWREHRSVSSMTSRQPKHPINYAIAKYGDDSFVISVIQCFDSEKVCLEAEKYWIRYYDSRNRERGYNLSEGGGSMSGYHHTPEARERMRAAQIGKVRSLQHKENIRLGRIGKKHPSSTLEKLSGENSANAKLTSDLVNEIRRLYATGLYYHRELAALFNISKTQITNILNKRQWK